MFSFTSSRLAVSRRASNNSNNTSKNNSNKGLRFINALTKRYCQLQQEHFKPLIEEGRREFLPASSSSFYDSKPENNITNNNGKNDTSNNSTYFGTNKFKLNMKRFHDLGRQVYVFAVASDANSLEEMNTSMMMKNSEEYSKLMNEIKMYIVETLCVMVEASMIVICHPSNSNVEFSWYDFHTSNRMCTLLQMLISLDRETSERMFEKIKKKKGPGFVNEFFSKARTLEEEKADIKRIEKELEEEEEDKTKNDEDNKTNNDASYSPTLAPSLSGLATRVFDYAMNSSNAVASAIAATHIKMEHLDPVSLSQLAKHSVTFFNPAVCSHEVFLKQWAKEVLLAKAKFRNPRLLIELIYEISGLVDSFITERRTKYRGLLIDPSLLTKIDKTKPDAATPASSTLSNNNSFFNPHFHSSHLHLYENLDFADEDSALDFVTNDCIIFMILTKHPIVFEEVLMLLRKALVKLEMPVADIDDIANLNDPRRQEKMINDIQFLIQQVEKEQIQKEITGNYNTSSLNAAGSGDTITERIQASLIENRHHDKVKVIGQYKEATNPNLDSETRRKLLSKFVRDHYQHSYQFSWTGGFQTCSASSYEVASRYAEENAEEFEKNSKSKKEDQEQEQQQQQENNDDATKDLTEDQLKRHFARHYRTHRAQDFGRHASPAAVLKVEDEMKELVFKVHPQLKTNGFKLVEDYSVDRDIFKNSTSSDDSNNSVNDLDDDQQQQQQQQSSSSSSSYGTLYGIPVRPLKFLSGKFAEQGGETSSGHPVSQFGNQYETFTQKKTISSASHKANVSLYEEFDDDRQQQQRQQQSSSFNNDNTVTPALIWIQVQFVFLALCQSLYFLTFTRDSRAFFGVNSSMNAQTKLLASPSSSTTTSTSSNSNSNSNSNDDNSDDLPMSTSTLPHSTRSIVDQRPEDEDTTSNKSKIPLAERKYITAVQTRYTTRRAELQASPSVQLIISRSEQFVQNLLYDFHSNKDDFASMHPFGLTWFPSTMNIELKSRLASLLANTLIDFCVTMLPIAQDDSIRQRHIISAAMVLLRMYHCVERESPTGMRCDFLLRNIVLRIAENREIHPVTRVYVALTLIDSYAISRDRAASALLLKILNESSLALEKLGYSRRAEVMKNRLGHFEMLRHACFAYRWESAPPAILKQLTDTFSRHALIRDVSEFNKWVTELVFVEQIDDPIFENVSRVLCQYVMRTVPDCDFEDVLNYGRYASLFCRYFASCNRSRKIEANSSSSASNQKLQQLDNDIRLSLKLLAKLMQRACDLPEPTFENYFGASSSSVVSTSSTNNSDNNNNNTQLNDRKSKLKSQTTVFEKRKTTPFSAVSTSGGNTSSSNILTEEDENTKLSSNNTRFNSSQRPPFAKSVALQFLTALGKSRVHDHPDFRQGGKYRKIYDEFTHRVAGTLDAYPNQKQVIFSHLHDFLRYTILFAADLEDPTIVSLQTKAVDAVCAFFTRRPADFLPLARRLRNASSSSSSSSSLDKKKNNNKTRNGKNNNNNTTTTTEEETDPVILREAAMLSAQLIVDPTLVDPYLSNVTALQEGVVVAQKKTVKNVEVSTTTTTNSHRHPFAKQQMLTDYDRTRSTITSQTNNNNKNNVNDFSSITSIYDQEPIDHYSIALQAFLSASLAQSGFHSDFDSEAIFRQCRFAHPLGLHLVFRFMGHVADILYLTIRVQIQSALRVYFMENVFLVEPYTSLMNQFVTFGSNFLIMRLDLERVFDVGPPTMLRVNLHAEIALELLRRALVDVKSKNKSGNGHRGPPPKGLADVIGFTMRFALALDRRVSPLVGRRDDGSLFALLKDFFERETVKCFGTSASFSSDEEKEEDRAHYQKFLEEKHQKSKSSSTVVEGEVDKNNNKLSEILPDNLLYLKNNDSVLTPKLKDKIDYHFTLVPESIKKFMTFQECALFDFEYANQETLYGVDFTSRKSIDQWRRGLNLREAVQIIKELLSEESGGYPELIADKKVFDRVPYLVRAMKCRWFPQNEIDEITDKMFAMHPPSAAALASMPKEGIDIHDYQSEKRMVPKKAATILNSEDWRSHKFNLSKEEELSRHSASRSFHDDDLDDGGVDGGTGDFDHHHRGHQRSSRSKHDTPFKLNQSNNRKPRGFERNKRSNRRGFSSSFSSSTSSSTNVKSFGGLHYGSSTNEGEDLWTEMATSATTATTDDESVGKEADTTDIVSDDDSNTRADSPWAAKRRQDLKKSKQGEEDILDDRW